MSLMMLAERAVSAFERFAKAHEAIAEALRSGQVPLSALGLKPDGRVFTEPVKVSDRDGHTPGMSPAHSMPYGVVEDKDMAAKLIGAEAKRRADAAEQSKAKKPTHEDVRQALLRAADVWPKDPPDSKQAHPWASKQVSAIVTGGLGGPDTLRLTEIKEEFFPRVLEAARVLAALGAYAKLSGTPAALELLSKHGGVATIGELHPDRFAVVLEAAKPE